MPHNSPHQVSLSDNLVRDALKHWNTSIVESSGDFHRMKSTLTAIMPQLMQQFGEETASLAAAKTTQLRQNRRYKKLMRRCSQLNNALIKAKASKPVDVAAVRRQAFDEAVNTIYSRARGICTENVAHELAQIVRALSAEPVQGEQSDLEWLNDKANFEISHDWPEGGDESDDGVWKVHSVNGGRSDREWTLIAEDSDLSTAISKARKATATQITEPAQQQDEPCGACGDPDCDFDCDGEYDAPTTEVER